MKKRSLLAGKWTGDATAAMSPEGPVKMQQTEGTGRDTHSSKILSNALATISYDDAAKQYRIRAFNQERYLDTELKLGDSSFEWAYQSGPAKVINRMKLGEWIEIAEVTLGSQPPRKSVELNVKKLP